MHVTLTHDHTDQQTTTGSDQPQREIAELLNTREQTVASLRGQGYANTTIAEYLSVTKSAVRWHIENLNRNTDATSRLQLLDILTEGNPSA